MTTQVKPGTRCECIWEEIPGHGHVRWPNAMAAVKTCRRPAVRVILVTVPEEIATDKVTGKSGTVYSYSGTTREIPMCAPCAAYHEARQKAGA